MTPRWQEKNLMHALEIRRGVHLTGARQTGKTTLAEAINLKSVVSRSLDKLSQVRAAKSDPELFIHRKNGETLVIDEIQKAPELLEEIKIKVDHDNSPGQYLLTGSSNLRFLKTVKDSLAGRFGTIRLRTFTIGELNGGLPDFFDQVFNEEFRNPTEKFNKQSLIHAAFTGGYPEPLGFTQKDKKDWARNYLDDILTKDIKDITELRKVESLKSAVIWMLAHTSQLFTIEDFGSKTGLTRETAQTYIAALTALYLFDRIPAWSKRDYEKIGKRPKYIVTDTMLASTMLGWDEDKVLFDEHVNGKLAESWAYHEIVAQADILGDYSISHYRDSDKREIDFIVERDDGYCAGIEIKCGSVVGLEDFKHLKFFQSKFSIERFIGIVLYTGNDVLSFGNHMYAVPFANLM